MELLHAAGICNLTIDFYVKFRERHNGALYNLYNQLTNSKEAFKVEAVMEEESAHYERVHLHIRPNSLCKERAKYMGRVAMTVGEKLYTWSYQTGRNPAHVFSPFFA